MTKHFYFPAVLSDPTKKLCSCLDSGHRRCLGSSHRRCLGSQSSALSLCLCSQSSALSLCLCSQSSALSLCLGSQSSALSLCLGSQSSAQALRPDLQPPAPMLCFSFPASRLGLLTWNPAPIGVCESAPKHRGRRQGLKIQDPQMGPQSRAPRRGQHRKSAVPPRRGETTLRKSPTRRNGKAPRSLWAPLAASHAGVEPAIGPGAPKLQGRPPPDGSPRWPGTVKQPPGMSRRPPGNPPRTRGPPMHQQAKAPASGGGKDGGGGLRT
uniref:Uncharacterized protein n=1 Tax=Fundulus heteroclitus TaxID=8078 RepID=A0A3Q2PBR6_FUNHE